MWAGNDAPIIIVSRETNSGTHVYFLEEVVRKGERENTDIFAPQTLLMPSSVGITSEVQRNPNAIGYDGLGYVDPEHEKLIAVAKDAGAPYVMPSVETGADGQLSDLARPLHVHGRRTRRDIADYLDWIRGLRTARPLSHIGLCATATGVDEL